MLGKLLKHEFKATARLLLPIYIVLAVFTIMARIVLHFNFTGSLAIFTGFVTIAYIISLTAIIVISYVITILRFYRNLMTDEGYLMFTLPVKPHELINSKLIVSFLWNIACIVAVFLSLIGVFLNSERIGFFKESWSTVINQMERDFGSGNTTLFFIEFIILFIIGLIFNILMIYASISIGQLFSGHKVLGSFLSYIGISTVLQILFTAGTATLGFAFYQSIDDLSSLPQLILPIFLLTMAALSVLFYWLIHLLFRKKINLE